MMSELILNSCCLLPQQFTPAACSHAARTPACAPASAAAAAAGRRLPGASHCTQLQASKAPLGLHWMMQAPHCSQPQRPSLATPRAGSPRRRTRPPGSARTAACRAAGARTGRRCAGAWGGAGRQEQRAGLGLRPPPCRRVLFLKFLVTGSYNKRHLQSHAGLASPGRFSARLRPPSPGGCRLEQRCHPSVTGFHCVVDGGLPLVVYCLLLSTRGN